MEERLRYILSLCIDWVKYAEKKNAALLVASSGLVISLIGRFPDKTSPTVRICFWIGLSALTLSAVMCLLSFIPQITFPWRGSKSEPSEDDNLFFFGHIANYTADDLLDHLYRAEGVQPVLNKIQLDLAGQIIVNACISFEKFRVFTVAVWLAGIGIGALISAAVLILTQ